MSSELESLLWSLAGQRVVVVGDVMLDEYLLGTVKRVSPEAPVLVVDVDRISWAPGGAANVAANVRALGGEVSIAGLIGRDDAGRRLREQLDSLGVETGGLIEDPSRDTTLKTRIIAGHQQVVRVDREKRDKPDARVTRGLSAAIAGRLESAGAVVISDYDKGIIGQLTLDVVEKARSQGRKVASNPKPRNLRWFHGVNLLTLNHPEAEAASGDTIDDEKSLQHAGEKILERTGADWLVITRGSQGMSVFGSDGCPPEHIPVLPVEVYDVAGAGDTVVSTLTLALAAGADVISAARLANFAGASVVRKLGVASAVPAEIAHLIRDAENPEA